VGETRVASKNAFRY